MITVAFVGFYDHAIPPALKNPEESCDKSGSPEKQLAGNFQPAGHHQK